MNYIKVYLCGLSLRKVGQGFLKLLIGKALAYLTPVTLTFNPVTLKTMGFLCNPG